MTRDNIRYLLSWYLEDFLFGLIMMHLEECIHAESMWGFGKVS